MVKLQKKKVKMGVSRKTLQFLSLAYFPWFCSKIHRT